MKKIVYLSVSCDTDPDINPPYRQVAGKTNYDDIWQGILVGIPLLRQNLSKTGFMSKYGQLPISWLLRCDRQIYEVYGDASFCFKRFEKTWSTERDHGSEIGWHPHLWKWDESICRWTENLGNDDDNLEILEYCLNSLRQCSHIGAVRTGWVYHSNKLFSFFDKQGLLVDASAIPGTVQSGTWFFDWRGAPRTPYFPSKLDYRHPSESREQALSIIEMPVLVRGLSFSCQSLRYCLRKLRSIRGQGVELTDWESSRYQGVRMTSKRRLFHEAIQQTLALSPGADVVFLNTYFHTDELLSRSSILRFVRNLENIASQVERLGRTLVPITLSAAAPLAKSTVTIS